MLSTCKQRAIAIFVKRIYLFSKYLGKKIVILQFTITNQSFTTYLLTHEGYQGHVGSINIFSFNKIVSLCYFCKPWLVMNHSGWNKFFKLKSVKGKWQQDKRQLMSGTFLQQPFMPVQNGKSSKTRQEGWHILCYSWWKNTFLALASKSLSSKSQIVCGRRVLAARAVCFGKSREREIWMQETHQSNFGTEEAEMGWVTWECICLLAASGSLLAKYKCSSHAFTFRNQVYHFFLLGAPSNFHQETLHLVVYSFDKTSILGWTTSLP